MLRILGVTGGMVLDVRSKDWVNLLGVGMDHDLAPVKIKRKTYFNPYVGLP